MTKGWDESSVTWKTPWDSGGGNYDTVTTATNTNDIKEKWEEFDVTDLVKKFADNSLENHGFMIKFPYDPTVDFGSVAYSSEYSAISKRPKLTIYYSESE